MFTGSLTIRYINGDLWEVLNHSDNIFSFYYNGEDIVPENGFVSDLASVPRILWSLLPPSGKYAPAAVIHDYLYRLPGCSRFLADAIFREVMAQLGVSFWKRCVMYYAVRFFGRGFDRVPEGKTLLDPFD